MIKIENTEIYGWHSAIKKLYNGKGVRKSSSNFYEAYISNNGKFVSCGTYQTKEQAQKAVIDFKIKLFETNIIAYGDNPAKIVESTEKGYFASPNGNIYNRHGKLMIGAINYCGYRHIILNKKNRNVHRIIAETFIPNPNNLPCVNHKDGNKLNNSVYNLEWCIYSENVKHSYDNNLEHKQYGERHHSHKLTKDNVKYIGEVYIKRDPQYGAVALSKKFNIDRTTIYDIIKGKTWGWLV